MKANSKIPKTLVYTAIFGDKDEPPVLLNSDKVDISQYDFICITDNPKLESDIYKIHHVKSQFTDITKNARFYKICGHSEQEKYDVAIWHDSSLMLDALKISELAIYAFKYKLSTFRHGHICIYPEARQCIEMEKDNPIRIAIQISYYALILNFPLREGMYETGILVKNVKQYNESLIQKIWWKHLRWFSRRDQLSLPVASWLTNSDIGILKGKAFDNPYSTYRGHRYYHYLTGNPIWRFNHKILKKLGVWVTFRVEHALTRKRIFGKYT